MDKTTVVTIEITERQKEKLRTIAKGYGMTIGRGRECEWGSIRKLNEAIATGQLLVLKNPQYQAVGNE